MPGVMSSPIVQFPEPYQVLDGRAHHVGERLVQRTRQILVDQVARGLGDAVAQLVADDVEIAREFDEGPPVAVSVHHLRAVPARVVVITAEVGRGSHALAVVLEPVEPERLQEQVSDVGVEVRVHECRLPG